MSWQSLGIFDLFHFANPRENFLIAALKTLFTENRYVHVNEPIPKINYYSLVCSCRPSNSWHRLTCTHVPQRYFCICSLPIGQHSIFFVEVQSPAFFHTHLQTGMETFPPVFCKFISATISRVTYLTLCFGSVYCILI